MTKTLVIFNSKHSNLDLNIMPTSTIVNLDPLKKLLRDNKSAIKKALELFIESTTEDMQMLGLHVNDKKMLEAARIAHALKTRFVYLGNDDAIFKIKRLETLLKEGRETTFLEIKELFENLNLMINSCLLELNEELNALN
jgi:HPt (histidine-containing phosphotransfer) domain-containing protein